MKLIKTLTVAELSALFVQSMGPVSPVQQAEPAVTSEQDKLYLLPADTFIKQVKQAGK